MISLYIYGEIDDDFIRRKSGPLKEKRQRLQEELQTLEKQKETLEQVELAEDRVEEFCWRVRQNLARLDFEDRRQALKALSVRVTAYGDRIEIRGVLPTYVTTEQTSA